MRHLLLMRHAKSSWVDETLPDIERPLHPRGKRDAKSVGAELARRELLPDWIVSSPARRARASAKRVARACGYVGELHVESDLYGAGVQGYWRTVQHLPPQATIALIVGHNPDIEELVTSLSGQSISMPTAAVALFDLAIDTWNQVHPACATLHGVLLTNDLRSFDVFPRS